MPPVDPRVIEVIDHDFPDFPNTDSFRTKEILTIGKTHVIPLRVDAIGLHQLVVIIRDTCVNDFSGLSVFALCQIVVDFRYFRHPEIFVELVAFKSLMVQEVRNWIAAQKIGRVESEFFRWSMALAPTLLEVVVQRTQ